MEYRTALDHFITGPNFTTVTSIRLILISISPTSLHNLAKLKVNQVGIDNLPSIFFTETPCRDSDECLVYLFQWLKDLNSFYPESLYKLYISVWLFINEALICINMIRLLDNPVRGPLGFIKIRTWISNYILSFLWDMITHPYSDVNSRFAKPPLKSGFKDWMNDYILHLCIRMSSNGNIFRVTGPLCGEFTGPGEFPTQRPVARSFDVFFDRRLNKRLNKQPWGWWFETPSWSLWRQCNVVLLYPFTNLTQVELISIK